MSTSTKTATAVAARPAPVLRPIEETDLPVIRAMIVELAIFEKLEHEVTCTLEDLRTSLFPADADVLAGRAVKSARAVILERDLAPGEQPPADLVHPLSVPNPATNRPARLVLGFCLYFFNYSTFLGQHGVYVEDLCVRAPFRVGGYGTILLHSVIRHAVVVHGAKRVEWSVLNWNENAIRFYADKCGAKPQDEWTVYRVTGDRLAQYRDYVPSAQVEGGFAGLPAERK
ncbi:hypothetical protein GGF32_000110 [Allomyces javanicus]|nr:hypothetical protein GGF32_000110 [Allomyces javanicus]